MADTTSKPERVSQARKSRKPRVPRKARRTAEETREHVLDVAHELFYWTGIRATGVDRVAADAGIAPTALYRLFPSKDARVAAYVERAEQRYREWFANAQRARQLLAELETLSLSVAEKTEGWARQDQSKARRG